MALRYLSGLCVTLTKTLKPADSSATVSTKTAVKLNELAIGDHTYLVLTYNGNSEVVKYTHTATIP